MATSSITKQFYVRDQAAYERLKKELDTKCVIKPAAKHSSAKKGKEKLATFVFR